MPPKAKKMFDEAIAKAEKNEALLKSLIEKDEAATFAKRAADLGLGEAHGETLRKAYAGDKDGVAKLEALMKGLAEQARTGKVFAEFGTNKSNAGATAKAEMDAKVDELAKSAKISKAQAFTQIYTDSAHADLKKRYDDEDALAKRARA
jgi:hypothetical protein